MEAEARQQKTAKIIRTLTVAPLMAAVLLTLLVMKRRESMGGWAAYVTAMAFLTVLPLLAYPLQPLLPGYREKGREGQRKLAIIMAVLGYLGGICAAAATHARRMMWVIYLTYLLSGLGIALFNKIFHIKASGHACGVTGPVILSIYYLGWAGLLGLLALLPVFWSSIKMKRHTPGQLFWGCVIPVVSFCMALLASGVIC